jgi:hypothetical protein
MEIEALVRAGFLASSFRHAIICIGRSEYGINAKNKDVHSVEAFDGGNKGGPQFLGGGKHPSNA